MHKKLWFKIHWILGVVAGVFLLLIGVSGAILSFQKEITKFINKDSYIVSVPENKIKLSTKDMLDNFQTKFPDAKIKIYYAYSIPYEKRLNFYSFEEKINESQNEAKQTLLKTAHDFYNSLEIKNKSKFILKESELSVENLIKDSKNIEPDLIAVHTTGFFSFFAFYLVEHSKINILIKKMN